MITERTATCACKKIEITLSANPDAVLVCSCTECQRRTGSAFGISAFYNESKLVSKSGDTNAYKRIGESGEQLEFFFCANCGTSVWWTANTVPGYLAAAVGCFADPEFPVPLMSLWEQTKHPWVKFKFPPLSLKSQFPGFINRLIFSLRAAKPIYGLLELFKPFSPKRRIEVSLKKCGLLEAYDYLSEKQKNV